MTGRPQRSFVLGAALLCVVAGLAVAGPAGGPAVAATARCTVFFDTDGNGTDDLPVGTPGENVGTVADAGTVTLVYGDSAGVFGRSGSLVLDQEDVGLVSQAGDRFGAAVATADLNGDGCADLAIGVPGEAASAGAVVVLYGSPTGIHPADPTQRQLLRQGAAPVGQAAEAGDKFGRTLAAAGILPSGGAAGLWIGAPGEDLGTTRDAGLVTEIPTVAGSPLGAVKPTNWTQSSPGVPGGAEAGDQFGSALAGGPHTVLVGIPLEDVGSTRDAGSYAVFELKRRTWTTFSQDSSGVPGVAEAGDRFGASVAHGLGCGSATDESWAVGAPGEDIGSVKDAGSVTLRDWSTKRGITLAQGTLGIPGGREPGDGFGSSLADAGVLAIGAPGEDIGAAKDAGLVTLVELGCNAVKDLRPDVSSAWSQNSAGVPGIAGAGNLFSQSLGAALVSVAGGPLELRLIVGAPGEDEGAVNGSGTVTVFVSSSSGFTVSGSRAFGQATATIGGDPEPGDGFGGSLDSSNAQVL